MGMYNEVYKACPMCGGQAETQIGQIVLGFGNFSLEDPSSLTDLTIKEIISLRERVTDVWFTCNECSHSFIPYPSESIEEKLGIIKKLF